MPEIMLQHRGVSNLYWGQCYLGVYRGQCYLGRCFISVPGTVLPVCREIMLQHRGVSNLYWGQCYLGVYRGQCYLGRCFISVPGTVLPVCRGQCYLGTVHKGMHRGQ